MKLHFLHYINVNFWKTLEKNFKIILPRRVFYVNQSQYKASQIEFQYRYTFLLRSGHWRNKYLNLNLQDGVSPVYELMTVQFKWRKSQYLFWKIWYWRLSGLSESYRAVDEEGPEDDYSQ